MTSEPSSGLNRMRISSSSAASPVAANMISGHGSEPGFIMPRTEQEREDTGGDDEDPRNVPVQKKSKTLPPPPETDAACNSTVTQSRKPKIRKPTAAADLQPVGCLELAQIHICLQVRRTRPRAHRTPCKALRSWNTPRRVLSVHAHCAALRVRQDRHRRAGRRPARLGWRIVSSGGTAKAIAAAGTPVTDLAELTGVPAILDHRVVTLHPKVHGGLLADPDQARAPGRHGRVRHRADRPGGRATCTRSRPTRASS